MGGPYPSHGSFGYPTFFFLAGKPFWGWEVDQSYKPGECCDKWHWENYRDGGTRREPVREGPSVGGGTGFSDFPGSVYKPRNAQIHHVAKLVCDEPTAPGVVGPDTMGEMTLKFTTTEEGEVGMIDPSWK